MDEPVDSHVHVWIDDGLRYPRLAGSQDYPPGQFPPEVYLSHARLCGATRAVLVQMSFYGFDNSYLLDSMRTHPGIFSGIAVVDSASDRPEEAMRRLAGDGVRGFRIAPGNRPHDWLETPGMRAMWRFGAEHRLAMCPLINPSAIEAIDAMCSRFPDTVVIIDHLARIGADGPIRDNDVRLLCGLARLPNVFVKVSAFYALGDKRAPYDDLVPMIQRVYESYGPRRLMWGSDCPFQIEGGHSYAASIDFVRERLPFLSDEDRAWLLSRTAAAWFFGG